MLEHMYKFNAQKLRKVFFSERKTQQFLWKQRERTDVFLTNSIFYTLEFGALPDYEMFSGILIQNDPGKGCGIEWFFFCGGCVECF